MTWVEARPDAPAHEELHAALHQAHGVQGQQVRRGIFVFSRFSHSNTTTTTTTTGLGAFAARTERLDGKAEFAKGGQPAAQEAVPPLFCEATLGRALVRAQI